MRASSRSFRASQIGHLRDWRHAVFASDWSLPISFPLLAGMPIPRQMSPDFPETGGPTSGTAHVAIRNCRTPIVVPPDDILAHPYRISVDVASLAPSAEITVFP